MENEQLKRSLRINKDNKEINIENTDKTTEPTTSNTIVVVKTFLYKFTKFQIII